MTPIAPILIALLLVSIMVWSISGCCEWLMYTSIFFTERPINYPTVFDIIMWGPIVWTIRFYRRLISLRKQSTSRLPPYR